MQTVFASFTYSKVGFKEVMMAASPCISCGNMKQVEEIAKDLIAYDAILDIGLRTYQKPTMVDNGEFFIEVHSAPTVVKYYNICV